MSIFLSYKKIFLLGFLVVILIAIPLSVYIAQKRQSIKSKATASTTLSFDPASPTVKVGDSLTLNVVLDPGTGPSANQVSFVKLSISFNPSRFTAESLKPSTDPSNTLTSVLEDAALTSGRATISLSIGADPTKVVTTKTTIALLQIKALSSDPNNPKSSVAFDPAPNTQVLSIASSDQTSENVLSSAQPVDVTITGTGILTPSPTSVSSGPSAPTPTSVSSPSSLSPTRVLIGGTPIGAPPICSSLTVDSPTSGIAPYPLTFTAVGSDSDGTITKVSFNFGDGPIQDLIVGGGIGTATVNSQLAHTFNTPGIYSVYAILTDNKGNLSNQTDSCTKTITINSNIGAVTPTFIPLVKKGGLPPTGPQEILGVGAIGAILTIIGGALLILL